MLLLVATKLMRPLELILPVLILALAFLMKLFVDRAPNLPKAIETTIELPIDIVFLALAFASACVITKPKDPGPGFSHFVVYVIIALVSVALARRSRNCFDQENRWLSGILSLANFAVTIIALATSMKLVTGK